MKVNLILDIRNILGNKEINFKQNLTLINKIFLKGTSTVVDS